MLLFDDGIAFSFRSIEELHEQNLKLLQVVRELSEAGEAKERGQMRNDEDSQRSVLKFPPLPPYLLLCNSKSFFLDSA